MEVEGEEAKGIEEAEKGVDQGDLARFFAEFPAYGYEGTIDALRRDEFSRLDNGVGARHVFLDHAGATLHSERQMSLVHDRLCSSVHCNPHSSKAGTSVWDLRQAVLRSMNTTDEHYAVIFTSGATAAQKLVGECFPWSPSSEFCHTMDNHTSILGIREYVRAAGAQTTVVDHNSACQCSGEHFDTKRQARGMPTTSPTFSLYAFPAESNFSGRRYDLSRHLLRARSGGIGHSGPQATHTWKVLVDAAKYCATSPLDLSQHDADFVTISLYKIFGYPTGLGCLVVRRDALSILKKPYFGGGTVDAVSATDNFLVTRAGPERFEDGTLNFLAIESALVGFSDVLGRRPLSRIAQHLEGLTIHLVRGMRALRHGSGEALCEVYGHGAYAGGDGDGVKYGPVVAFNLRRPSGAYVGYSEVGQLATGDDIMLRTGCFCNPGACQYYLGLDMERVRANLEAGHRCGDDKDLIEGKPTGAVRISLGYMSTFEDVEYFLSFLRQHFLVSTITTNTITTTDTTASFLDPPREIVLEHILLYPIKSCAGMAVSSWPLGPKGLLLDRHWALVDAEGAVLTQHREPRMALVVPCLDLTARTLTLTVRSKPGSKDAEDSTPLVVALDSDLGLDLDTLMSTTAETTTKGSSQTSVTTTVHGSRRGACRSNARVSDWFTEVLGCACHLVCSDAGGGGDAGRVVDKKEIGNFSNEGSCLLVSEESVESVRRRSESMNLQKKGSGEQVAFVSPLDYARRFRPNFIVSGARAFEEDTWVALSFCAVPFRVQNPCTRCAMVNVNPSTGGRRSNLFATLSSTRRTGSRVAFGLLVEAEGTDLSTDHVMLHTGAHVEVDITPRQPAAQHDSDGPGHFGGGARLTDGSKELLSTTHFKQYASRVWTPTALLSFAAVALASVCMATVVAT